MYLHTLSRRTLVLLLPVQKQKEKFIELSAFSELSACFVPCNKWYGIIINSTYIFCFQSFVSFPSTFNRTFPISKSKLVSLGLHLTISPYVWTTCFFEPFANIFLRWPFPKTNVLTLFVLHNHKRVFTFCNPIMIFERKFLPT